MVDEANQLIYNVRVRNPSLPALMIFFSFLHFAYASDSVTLEKIIIKKHPLLSTAYRLEASDWQSQPLNSLIEPLRFAFVDLAGRSPSYGIQSDFSLRGSTFEQTSILLNGLRINDPQTGHHNSDLPLTLNDVERIEVNGLRTNINFILRKPEEKEKIIENSFGTNRSFSQLLSITEKLDYAGMRFSLEHAESDGFYYDTDFKKVTSNLYLNWEAFGDSEIDTFLGYNEKEFGAYAFYTPGEGYPSKEWTKTYLFMSSLKLRRDNFSLSPRLFWRRHYDKFMLHRENPSPPFCLNHHYTDIYNINFYSQIENMPFGDLGFGQEYGKEKINSTTLENHTREHLSLFADTEIPLGRNFSLRMDSRNDFFSGGQEQFSGSLGLFRRGPAHSNLHFGISRDIRLPSFNELYYHDPKTVGSSNLTSEKTSTLEVGYEQQREAFNFGITLFFRKEEDLIDWVKPASSEEQRWQAKNISKARVLGLEERLNLEISKALALVCCYSYIDKHIYEKDYLSKYGPQFSRHIFNTQLNFNLERIKAGNEFIYKKQPHRDGWFLWNWQFAYRLNPQATLFVKCSNFLNVEYQEIPGIPSPGRQINLGLRWSW